MSQLVITRGLPASGKTTYAGMLCGHVRVNRDDLRFMTYGKFSGLGHEGEKAITEASHSLVEMHLRAGRNVVADDTNLRPRYVREWRKLAERVGAEFMVIEIPADVEECVERDAKRERIVGEDVIRNMARKFMPKGEFLPVPDEEMPQVLRPYVTPEGKPSAVIVDIDGTLARMDGRGPYDLHLVGNDQPVQPIIDLVKVLWAEGAHVIFMSGREDSCREDTEWWLRRHVGFNPDDKDLYMRAAGDKRRDSVVKAELFDEHVRDNYDVKYVLDDRNQVVDMWRSLGLTCLQVADGDF